jgi:hypothetical protein
VAEKMVRCPRCFEVFDAEEGPCPKCGTPFRPPAPQPRPIEGLYTERYAEPAETPMPTFAPGPKPPRKLDPALLIGGGAVLIGGALVVAILVTLTGAGGTTPTAPPRYVVPAQTPGTAAETLGPIVAMTFSQVGGYHLDAHVTVQTTVQVSVKVNGKAQSIATRFDGHVSEANQSGVWNGAGVSQEMRLVDGQFYVRTPPSGKWSVLPIPPSYLLVSPALGIRSTDDLVMQGPATREGRPVNHIQSSASWIPDINRLAMTDLSTLPVQPDTFLLDLWVTDEGIPVWASVSATKIDASGAKLIDVEVAYTFTDVGVPTPMVAPISPSPAPSQSPTPSR